MKILTVGCGNAFSKINFNQSFLLEENGKTLLIDCGSKIISALDYLSIDIKKIDNIYISHAHSDHIGSLEEIAFTRYDWKNKPRNQNEWKSKSTLVAPNLIANEVLLKELWECSLRGGLKSMEGFDAELETFFNPIPIQPNKHFVFEGWDCKLIQQIHVMTGSMIMNTFGLFLEKQGHSKVYFTTDSQHCSPKQMEVFYKDADIIFQDCETIGVIPNEKKFLFSSGVHANYAQLAGYDSANSVKLPLEIKNKMYLSHYQDFIMENKDFMGNSTDWEEIALSDGFLGFTKVGDILEV
jgi:ribonuclease BN (tRNA processing enzyme)